MSDETAPQYVRRRLSEQGISIDSTDPDEPQREYAVLRDVLETTKAMRATGASVDEIREALGFWSELVGWAMHHPVTAPDSDWTRPKGNE